MSIKAGLPLASDCVDILVEEGNLKAIRQIYSGKIFSKVSFRSSDSYMITVRPGAFPADVVIARHGEVIRMDVPESLPEVHKKFLEFVDAGYGAVDISQADLLVSIGRGIGRRKI